MQKAIRYALIDIVGKSSFSDSLIDLISYSSDASSEYRSRPDAALWPQSTDQVSAILKLANTEKIPVIPRGAGTGLVGMTVPITGGIVLDMARMNKVISIRIEDRLVEVEPGVVYAHLDRMIAPHGFAFPPDPASGKAATIGGNVATNAGGLRGAKYGTTRDYVLGLEVVLADGSVLRTGSYTMKCASGYDLTRMFVGSEGTLGVITRIVLKISPRPQRVSTCSATFDNIRDAGKAISDTMKSGIIPAVLEILDRACINALKKDAGLDLPEAEAIVLAETDGHTEVETEYQISRIIDIFRDNKAQKITKASSPTEAESLWRARRSIGGILYRMSYNMIAEDVTVPISKVPELLVGTKAISERYDIPIPTLGHLGDGNLHPNIIYDGRNLEDKKRAEKAAAELFELCIKLGGTLTGEHGIGLAKAPFMHLEHTEIAMRTMRRLKRLFDPNNILNPGKMALDG